MGILLKASCIKCGFETKVSFGAGMLSFETKCMVPALNKLNGIFVCENIFEKDQLGDNIIFYNDPKMHQGEI